MNKKDSRVQGQTVLIILLIVAVILTIGLSTISSTITDIKVTQQTEESSRAYYVAESGLEESFLRNSASSGVIGNIQYDVTESWQGGTTEFLFPFSVLAGDPQNFWLVDHDRTTGAIVDTLSSNFFNGDLNICWSETTAEKPALMVTIVYKQVSTYKIFRFNFDPDPTRGNFFQLADTVPGGVEIEGKNLKYCVNGQRIVVPANSYFVRLNLVYNTTPQSVGVKSLHKVVGGTPPDLKEQGPCFESTAIVLESGITRKIRQCKMWPNLPNIFSWGLFSREGDLD